MGFGRRNLRIKLDRVKSQVVSLDKNCIVLVLSSTLLIICQGCRPGKTISPDESNTIITSVQSGILFLNLKVFMDEEDKEQVTLVNKFWSEGTFKERINDSFQHPNSLKCEFLTSKKEVIKTLYVKNPRFSLSESFGEAGDIKREINGLKEAPLMIRTQIKRNVAFVRIMSNTNDVTHLIDLR